MIIINNYYKILNYLSAEQQNNIKTFFTQERRK